MQVTLLCKKGFTDKELAEFYKVSRRTIARWKADEQFLSHLKKGKELADDNVERSLYERACGYSHPEDKIFIEKGKPIIVATTKHYPPEPIAAIFWLKNRKPEVWREKAEVKTSGETIITVKRDGQGANN